MHVSSSHLVLEDYPRFVFMRHNNYPRLLEPGFSIHLHWYSILALDGELGIATLGNTLVLDPENLGGGDLGYTCDSHNLH